MLKYQLVAITRKLLKYRKHWIQLKMLMKCSMQLCLSLLQLLNLLMLNCLFRRDNVFKVLNKVTKEIQLPPRHFVMSDRFLHSLVCLGHTHPYLNRGVKNFKTVRNSCHLLKLLVTLKCNV